MRPCHSLSRRRAARWGLLVAKLVGGWGLTYGWYTTIRPALQPMIPTAGETLVALVLTAAAGGGAGAAARWLAYALDPSAEGGAAPSLVAPAVTPAGR